MKRVLFFGASVTAQSHGNGYFDLVQQALQASGIQADVLAHGSCHFDDAGFHAVANIHWSGLTHCLLDWNTTGLSRFEPIKLNFVVDQMLAHEVLPIFMILPQERTLGQDREAELQVMAVSRLLGLPWLDLRAGFVPEGLLRDWVHTSPEGAHHYAQHIVEFIQLHLLTAAPTDFAALRHRLHAQQAVTHFELGGQEGNWQVSNGQRLELDYRLKGPSAEILFDLQIGPDSAVVSVSVPPMAPLQLSLWDPWCHYERRKQLTLVPARLFRGAPKQGTLQILVTDKEPDYSRCKLAGFEYKGTRALRALEIKTANVDLLSVRLT